MKNKLFIWTILFILLFSSPVFANDDNSLEQKLQKIGLFASAKMDDNVEIQKLFSHHSKWANSQKMKKLQSVYADKYRNFDGLSRTDFFKMIQETWDLYANLVYTTEIKNIDINGTYATVDVLEITKGKTKNVCETTQKIGNVYSDSRVIYHLEKFGKTWQIVSDNILAEHTYLLYGDANDIPMSINSPAQVANDEEYNVIFDIKLPKGYFALGSISNEPIVYPQIPPKEVFRNMQQDAVLERVVKSNNDNKNEYAIASIGLTKAEMSADNQLNIQVAGLGFIMNRVNVLHLTKAK
ncbi:hypothetical protein J6Q66_02810 [bacterium]|nr:hypothetical protein [bacterium]